MKEKKKDESVKEKRKRKRETKEGLSLDGVLRDPFVARVSLGEAIGIELVPFVVASPILPTLSLFQPSLLAFSLAFSPAFFAANFANVNTTLLIRFR